jgi:hypothetical protein
MQFFVARIPPSLASVGPTGTAAPEREETTATAAAHTHAGGEILYYSIPFHIIWVLIPFYIIRNGRSGMNILGKKIIASVNYMHI